MKNTQKIRIQVGNTCDTHGAMLCEGIEMPTVKKSPYELDRAFIKIDNVAYCADMNRIVSRRPGTHVYHDSTHYSTCAIPQTYWNEETRSFYYKHKQEIDSLEMLATTK
jgi:hypothetical protein